MGIFFDIKGAFDNLWWPALMEELKKLNIHIKLWQLIKNYFVNRIIEADMADGTIKKTPTRGCPQGSVLGPVFWDIAFQPCLVKLNEMTEAECVVGYADDLVVVIKGNSRNQIEQKGNNITTALTSWCKNNKLQVSAEKTKYVLFKGKLNRNRGPIIKINNKTIKREEHFKYLGITLDEKLNFRHVTNAKN